MGTKTHGIGGKNVAAPRRSRYSRFTKRAHVGLRGNGGRGRWQGKGGGPPVTSALAVRTTARAVAIWCKMKGATMLELVPKDHESLLWD